MFIIQKSGIDISCHSLMVDAERQKQLFIDNGLPSGDIEIVEKEEFTPEDME